MIVYTGGNRCDFIFLYLAASFGSKVWFWVRWMCFHLCMFGCTPWIGSSHFGKLLGKLLGRLVICSFFTRPAESSRIRQPIEKMHAKRIDCAQCAEMASSSYICLGEWLHKWLDVMEVKETVSWHWDTHLVQLHLLLCSENRAFCRSFR